MASSKRKLMQDDKRFLLEKIHRIEERQHWLTSRIQDISSSNIAEAQKLLEETDRKRFQKQYKQVNHALEMSLDTLRKITATFPSSENDNDESDSTSSSAESLPDSASCVRDDSLSVFSSVSATTLSSCGSLGRSHGSKAERRSPEDMHRLPPESQTQTGCLAEAEPERRRDAPAPSGSSVAEGCPDSGRTTRTIRDSTKAVQRDPTRGPPGFHPQGNPLAGADRAAGESAARRTLAPAGKAVSQAPRSNELTGSPGDDEKALPQGSGDASSGNGRHTPQPGPAPFLSTTRPAQANPGQPHPPPTLSQPLPYRHVSKDKETAVIRPMDCKSISQAEVIVSEVKTPAVIWIQLADSPLDNFAQRLNLVYSNYQNIPIPFPDIGTFCCACFTEDDSWYRARIVGIHDHASGQPLDLGNPAGIVVDVIYVDYGNREKLNLTRVRVLSPAFTKLPAQSFCCSMAKIKPPILSSGWSKEQVDVFKSLLLGKKVRASVTVAKGHSIPMLDITAPVVVHSEGDRRVIQVDVATVMVERQMAQFRPGYDPSKEDPPQPPDSVDKPTCKTSGCNASQGTGCSTGPEKNGSKCGSSETEDRRKMSDDGSDRCTAKESPHSKQPTNTTDKSKEQRQEEMQTDTTSGYSELEADKNNPFPRSRHHSNPSWKQGKQSESQSGIGGQQPHSQSTEVRRSRVNPVATSGRTSPVQDDKPRGWNTAPVSPPRLRGNPPAKNPPGGSRRHGSWAGRGNRISNSTAATAAPHNPRKAGKAASQEGGSTDRGSASAEPPGNFSDDTWSVEQSVSRRTGKVPGRQGASPPEKSIRCPDETGLGRISPNSSSGVSSCNSGPSDAGSNQQSTGQSGQTKTDRNCQGTQEEDRKDAAESNCKDVLEEHRKKTDSENSKNPGKAKKAKPDSAQGLNKPLSASSKNLSASTSSFVTAVTEMETEVFQSESSSPHHGHTSSAASSFGSSRRAQAETRDRSKSPAALPLHVGRRENLPTRNGCVRLAMSHIVSPEEFYVHLISPDADKLDVLASDLNGRYSDGEAERVTGEVALEPGRFCAAKFSKDGTWYRAKILDVEERSVERSKETTSVQGAASELMVKVMYIDFGNQEWLAPDVLRPLLQEFYELPEQVIKCSLAHIKPPKKKDNGNNDAEIQKVGGWSDETVEEFARMTGYSKMLLGRVSKEYKADSQDPLEIILLDPSSPWEICINQELVNRGLVTSARFVPALPTEDNCRSRGVTKRQLLMASEGWSLQKNATGGYDRVPDSPEVIGQEVSQRDQWDPMLSDYKSARNSYNIDTDDPGVATVGHKTASTRQVCRFYSTGRLCYRGKQCPYDHVRKGERPLDSMDVFFLNNKVTLPPEGSAVALEVTALYSAFHFWAQLPFSARPLDSLQQLGSPARAEEDANDEETLEMLEDAMNQLYSALKPHQATRPPLRAPGEMVCCHCRTDRRHYRAKVINVNPDKDSIQVFYVDYGNSEWVPASNVYDIEQQFLHLPLQAVECCLVGAKPLDCNADAGARLSEEARQCFEEMVSNKTLVAIIIHVAHNDTLEVELYDTSGKSDVSLGEVLIENGLAAREGAVPGRVPSGKGSLKLSEGDATSDLETTSELYTTTPG